MVGLIQKIMLEMIKELAGETKVLEILKAANIPEDVSFHIDKVYSDEEWERLFSSTLKELNITKELAEQTYAKFFLKDSIHRFPHWFKISENSLAFLSIQPTIHNCFATSATNQKDKDAINDKFKVIKSEKSLITYYRSNNQLCGLYKALAQAVIDHYEDEASIEEKGCMKHGSDQCEIHINWNKLKESQNATTKI